MKIVLDCCGGDFSPNSHIVGAVAAVKMVDDLEMILVGREESIKPKLAEIYSGNKISVVHASEVIANDDVPTVAIKQKQNSSLVIGLDLLKNNQDVNAIVSAGSTGALLAGAVLKIGRMAGITRPALCPILPTLKGGQVALIDCGANVDCKSETLYQFAVMGSCYMSSVFGIEKPRVALLSNGTEDKKGNVLTKEVFELLVNSNLNFVGNMEGRDLISGDYDVIVADGFYGNIALKTCEGVAGAIFSILKSEIASAGLKGKLGALLLKPVLKKVKKQLDYNEIGGAGFLGVKKVVVKTHGSSKEKAICAGIMQAYKMVNNKVIEKITNSLK